MTDTRINSSVSDGWLAVNRAAPIDNFAFNVGVCYLCNGVIFIVLQLICAYLMHTDKEMQNPTYKFVVHLSICDVFELVAVGPYAGITILAGVQYPAINRWTSCIAISAWYTNCLLFLFISFSRWIAITRPQLVASLFSKRKMTIFLLVSWVPTTLMSFYVTVIQSDNAFFFYPEILMWGWNQETKAGEILQYATFGADFVIASVEMSFNIMSLVWVRQRRHEITSVAVSENRSREFKLLIQTFILGCVYTATSILCTLGYILGWSSRIAFVSVQGVWTFNHCVNPIVYLSVNTKLRKSFLKFVSCGVLGSKDKVESIGSSAKSIQITGQAVSEK